jgi:hypothetical protein
MPSFHFLLCPHLLADRIKHSVLMPPAFSSLLWVLTKTRAALTILGLPPLWAFPGHTAEQLANKIFNRNGHWQSEFIFKSSVLGFAQSLAYRFALHSEMTP